MKVSARNLFKGTVSKIQPGAVNAQVTVHLGNGDNLVSVITKESVESLKLREGGEVLAVIKAPWVILLQDAEGVRLSARNILAGTVKEVRPGAVNSEVIVTLAGGTEIAAIVTKDAVSELTLQPGSKVSAVVKASDVILGVPQ